MSNTNKTSNSSAKEIVEKIVRDLADTKAMSEVNYPQRRRLLKQQAALWLRRNRGDQSAAGVVEAVAGRGILSPGVGSQELGNGEVNQGRTGAEVAGLSEAGSEDSARVSSGQAVTHTGVSASVCDREPVAPVKD